MKSSRIILVVLVLAVTLLWGTPVFAIADPDTPPSVNDVMVFEGGLLEPGDLGIRIDYYLDYAVLPTETATDAYLAILIDTDGVTQIKSVAPYAYNDKGYGRGVIWMYFSAAEVTTYGLDIANQALYKIWLTGNPGLVWAGDPPKTIAAIDSWNVTGTMSVLIAQDVLNMADILELAWGVDLIEQVPTLGNRLTTTGEEYFQNVISNLRTIAPACFADTTLDPTLEDIDYSTSFGATLTNGTGTAAGSPITLAEGANNVNVTGIGTFTIELNPGTTGTAASDVGVVTSSPVTLESGTNTITTTGIGNIIVTVNLVDLVTNRDDTILGSVFDLTAAATSFGMSRWFFSGVVWLFITIMVCWAVYRLSNQAQGTFGYSGSGIGKPMLIIFDIMLIGGTVLGMMHPLATIMFFIGVNAFFGYSIFFKSSSV